MTGPGEDRGENAGPRPVPAGYFPRHRSKTQVGVEPTSTALQAVASPSGSRVTSQYPRQESNLDLDLRRVVSCPLHHKDAAFPGPESNREPDFRRVRCCPLHHRDIHKSRRLDSHQYDPAYETGAFLSRATPAIRPSGGNRTRHRMLHRHACSPLTTQTASVVPGGIEPPIFSTSRRRPTAERRDYSSTPTRI